MGAARPGSRVGDPALCRVHAVPRILPQPRLQPARHGDAAVDRPALSGDDDPVPRCDGGLAGTVRHPRRGVSGAVARLRGEPALPAAAPHRAQPAPLPPRHPHALSRDRRRGVVVPGRRPRQPRRNAQLHLYRDQHDRPRRPRRDQHRRRAVPADHGLVLGLGEAGLAAIVGDARTARHRVVRPHAGLGPGRDGGGQHRVVSGPPRLLGPGRALCPRRQISRRGGAAAALGGGVGRLGAALRRRDRARRRAAVQVSRPCPDRLRRHRRGGDGRDDPVAGDGRRDVGHRDRQRRLPRDDPRAPARRAPSRFPRRAPAWDAPPENSEV